MATPIVNQVPSRPSSRDTWLAAHERAKQLFLATLTPAELEFWNARKFLMVKGSDGVEYCLAAAQIFNVSANGVRFCAMPIENRNTAEERLLPLFDQLLAQKLYLEANAPEFLRIAHRDEPSARLSNIRIITTEISDS